VFIGRSTGYSNTTGNGNAFICQSSGFNNTTGTNNLFFGYNSGFNNNSGFTNMFIGPDSGFSNTFGNNNVFIGRYTGYSNTTGNNNVFIGRSAGYSNTNGNTNVFIGQFSGYDNTLGYSNSFLGYNSGHNNTLGYSNSFLGYNSGYNNETGYNNTFLGQSAGYYNTTGNTNAFIGSNAGFNHTLGYRNVFLGSNSGYSNTIGNRNTYLGYGSGYNTIGNLNTYLGTSSGYTSNGDGNIYIGNLCSQNNVGNNNVLIGNELYYSLLNPTTYSNKFAIYANNNSNSSGIPSTSNGSASLLIGGDFLTGTVGIGTISPDDYIGSNISITSTKLVVLGKVLANAYTNFTGAHNVNINNSINMNDLKEGMIMSSNGILDYKDINNTKVTVIPSNTINDKTVYGVYCGSEKVSNDDNTIILSTNYYVNAIGEGCILVSNYSGEIQNGDYITTCPLDGYGALQSDDIMHSYTVAKCTETIDWSSINESVSYNGNMYKVFLTGCTYHCG
jgi:hypothetical protein